MPRLIATDLDGTLVVTGSREVPPYTASVLRAADEAGVPVVFVTGRVERWMTGFWEHVGKHGFAILANGAITFDVPTRTAIDVRGIAPELGISLAARIHAVLPTAWIAVELANGDHVDLYGEGLDDAPADGGWVGTGIKILAKAPGLDAGAVRNVIGTVIAGVATATWSISGLVEISALGVTKASALQRLAGRLRIDKGDAIAFGDMPNDIPMMGWAGRSYAVADAHKTVTAIADDIVPAASDEGVAQEITRILQSRFATGHFAAPQPM